LDETLAALVKSAKSTNVTFVRGGEEVG
jgi:hypothetical protein